MDLEVALGVMEKILYRVCSEATWLAGKRASVSR